MKSWRLRIGRHGDCVRLAGMQASRLHIFDLIGDVYLKYKEPGRASQLVGNSGAVIFSRRAVELIRGRYCRINPVEYPEGSWARKGSGSIDMFINGMLGELQAIGSELPCDSVRDGRQLMGLPVHSRPWGLVVLAAVRADRTLTIISPVGSIFRTLSFSGISAKFGTRKASVGVLIVLVVRNTDRRGVIIPPSIISM